MNEDKERQGTGLTRSEQDQLLAAVKLFEESGLEQRGHPNGIYERIIGWPPGEASLHVSRTEIGVVPGSLLAKLMIHPAGRWVWIEWYDDRRALDPIMATLLKLMSKILELGAHS